MKLFGRKVRNPGDKKEIAAEEPIEDIQFNIIKFNSRPKPEDKRQILIISCFSEFGCETLGTMYCIPRLIQQYPGKYKIAMGWYGRSYLYRHLVDEFWEIKEEHQHLREYCRAFHHQSRNLSRVERIVRKYGTVVPAGYLGALAVNAQCNDCGHSWRARCRVDKCPSCGGDDLVPSLLGGIDYWKDLAVHVPLPSKEKYEFVDKLVKPNSVGIFARGRVCYGRNLQPGFYVKLIALLEEMKYTPIWLGEKQTTQPCPADHIVDFSRMPEARDLELTLAIISRLKFTIQFWTASTRLAGMMAVPYMLFESPDQIWGNGEEGFRRNLCDFGPSKLSINHFLNVYNDHDAALKVVRQCIEEMQVGNWDDAVGLVESGYAVQELRKSNIERIGG